MPFVMRSLLLCHELTQDLRLYTQLDISLAGPIAASRQARDPNFIESGGRVEVHSITPEEVLEQANRIFNPYKLKFAAPLSWFAVWKSMSLENSLKIGFFSFVGVRIDVTWT